VLAASTKEKATAFNIEYLKECKKAKRERA
jgi:hypothetical protein